MGHLVSRLQDTYINAEQATVPVHMTPQAWWALMFVCCAWDSGASEKAGPSDLCLVYPVAAVKALTRPGAA